MNPTLFNDIVNLLTPYMDEGQRDALIMPAFSGYPELDGKIDRTGAAGPFTVRLIRLLERYGEIETGRPALFHLLEEIRRHVGLDVRRDIDRLLRELKNSKLAERRLLRVFLCHGSSDKAEVRNIYNRLAQDSVDPWFDEEKLMPGQQWQQEISRTIRQSDVVVVILSHNAVNAEGYIRNEIRFALEVANELPSETIYIIPLKLEECDVPGQLAQWQWVDLFDSSGYERLINALQTRAEDIYIQPPIWNSGEYRYVTEYKQKKRFHLLRLYSGIIAIFLVIWVVGDYLSGLSTVKPNSILNADLTMTVGEEVVIANSTTTIFTDSLSSTHVPAFKPFHFIEQGNYQGETTTIEIPFNNCDSDEPLETTQNIVHNFTHSVNITKSSDSNVNEAALENDIRNHYQVKSLVDAMSYPVSAEVPANALFIYHLEWTEVWRIGNIEIGELDDSPEATYQYLETVTGGVLGFSQTECPTSFWHTHIIERDNYQGETTTSQVSISNCGSNEPLEVIQLLDHQFKHHVNITKFSDSNLGEVALEYYVRNHYQVKSLVDSISYPVAANVPANTIVIYELEWTDIWRVGDIEIGKLDDNPEATYEYLETVTGNVGGVIQSGCGQTAT